MHKYTTQSEATRILATELTQEDQHPGHGVISIPTHEQIAKRAYEIYMNTGRQPGHSTDDWLQAERELRSIGRRA